MNKIRVLFFATLREIVKEKEISLELENEITVRDLKTHLVGLYPGLAPVLEAVLVAVNREYARDNTIISEGAEVAFFPPVSGGGGPTYVDITEEPLNLELVLKSITLPTTGAACIFSGMVRGQTLHDQYQVTEYLEYESYYAMAEQKMLQVADEIRERWPKVEGIAIIQRVGRLYPGIPTVIIACSAAHRDSGAFEATRYGIDRLKEIVPIWKKEVGPLNETWIEGNYFPKLGE